MCFTFEICRRLIVIEPSLPSISILLQKQRFLSFFSFFPECIMEFMRYDETTFAVGDYQKIKILHRTLLAVRRLSDILFDFLFGMQPGTLLSEYYYNFGWCRPSSFAKKFYVPFLFEAMALAIGR